MDQAAALKDGEFYVVRDGGLTYAWEHPPALGAYLECDGECSLEEWR